MTTQLESKLVLPLNSSGMYTYVKTKSGCEVWFPINHNNSKYIEAKKNEVKAFIGLDIS